MSSDHTHQALQYIVHYNDLMVSPEGTKLKISVLVAGRHVSEAMDLVVSVTHTSGPLP